MTASNSELHEMENQVTKGAKPAEPKATTPNYVPDNAPDSYTHLTLPTSDLV